MRIKSHIPVCWFCSIPLFSVIKYCSMDWHLKIFKGINLKAEDLHVNKKNGFCLPQFENPVYLKPTSE
jgi:hypothetical protein